MLKMETLTGSEAPYQCLCERRLCFFMYFLYAYVKLFSVVYVLKLEPAQWGIGGVQRRSNAASCHRV